MNVDMFYTLPKASGYGFIEPTKIALVTTFWRGIDDAVPLTWTRRAISIEGD